jgi:hypothetical protein
MKREPGSLSVPQWTHPSLVEKRFNHQHCLTNRGEEEEGVVMCTRGYGMVADPGFMCNFAPGLHLYIGACMGPFLGPRQSCHGSLSPMQLGVGYTLGVSRGHCSTVRAATHAAL